jgi:hypothetical protein
MQCPIKISYARQLSGNYFLVPVSYLGSMPGHLWTPTGSPHPIGALTHYSEPSGPLSREQGLHHRHHIVAQGELDAWASARLASER